MAVIKLTIHAFLADIEAVKVETISMVTGTDTAQVGNYLYSLVGLSMNKQMYQPTMIVADISINKTEGTTWAPIKRDNIVEMFRFCRITLHGDDDVIGDDYYVHEVIPEYRTGSMVMRLHIFSLDKLLTLKQTSRSFVGKKLLGDILAKELPKYLLPFNKGKSMEFKTEDRIKTVHQLVYQNAQKATAEHIFPYLVQYNESFYDMLARTTNRWGEFMYYEDGNLQIGYDADSEVKTVQKFYKIAYSCEDASLDLLGNIKDGNYEAEAVYDKNIYDAPVPKSPLFVRGELGKFNGYGDKYAMKKIASFFNTDKNVISWAVNTLVDDGVSVLQAMSSTKLLNNEVNKKYFPEKDKVGTAEQYGTYKFTLYDEETESKDGFNEFTEITSQYANTADYYDASRYGKVLEFEQEAGNNMVFIDFDTTWPGLKLGQIIEVDGERFIVGNITASYSDNVLTFKVKASGAHVSEVGGKKIYDFYPAIIPSGHVRYSGPQLAIIKDADDPTFSHRVRVVFPWQGEADKADKKDATPWITFATKGDGKTTTGKHNAGDEVMVGFVDGNVERPYVMGALQTKVAYDQNLNVDFDTPGGHHMRLTDGTGGGLAKFVTSALSPIAETFFNFVPAPIAGKLFSDKSAFSGNKYFEGGFSLSDYYGIYKISGSTDKRNISISSPWGDVKLDAFTGITISAPNGDVKIKGKNVTIEAGNNLTLESGTNIGWKLFNDKKFGDLSAASLGLTVAAAIASKVAEKIKPIDLKIVRSVVEVVMRPVEGALTVKSNRFLKLEAGKKTCQYPTDAYSMKIRKRMYDDKEPELKDSAGNATDGVVELIKKTDKLVPAMADKWVKLYNDCVPKKEAFEALIPSLDLWRNDSTKPSCKTYKELKDTFWAAGDKNVTEADLGFDDNVSDSKLSPQAFVKFSILDDPSLVFTKRKEAKAAILQAANELRKAIVKVLKFEMTEKEVENAIGPFRWITVPKDSKKKVTNAVSREKCKDFPMYSVDFLDMYNYKNLEETMVMNSDSPKIQACRRMICLNLIKELDLDFHRTKDANKQEIKEPTFKNILDDDHVWAPYVNSLNATSEKLKGAVTLKSALKDSFIKPIKEGVTVMNLKKAYDEMCSWSEGNKGQILIGTGDGTYYVDDKATMQKISTFYAYDLEVKDPNAVNEVTTFLKKVKAVLLNI